MRQFKWKKIAVFYYGISFTTDVYTRFLEFVDEANEFEIVNREETRRIPTEMSKEEFREMFTPHF
jgi:hypothetical protein